MREARNWEYGIQGIYEEDNKKFAILVDDTKKLYRLDFSLTEDGLTLADEVVEVKQEFTETDNMKKFAEPENVAEYRLAECDECEHDDDEHEEEMSADEMKAKMADLEKDIESRDNIIMEKDAELEELRKFKAEVEEQRKAATVESIMAECKEYMSDEQYKEMREEGMACKMAEIDGWTNKVKAVSFSAVKKNVKKTNDGLFRFAAPINKTNREDEDVWTRLKRKSENI
jgi:membrane-associated HD superfamily phosphohydrolase